MLLGLAGRFGIDYILPPAKRLGPVPTTKEIYKEYIDVAWPATMQGLLLQLMTAINLAMVGALGADALAAVGIMSQPLMVMLVFCPFRSDCDYSHCGKTQRGRGL